MTQTPQTQIRKSIDEGAPTRTSQEGPAARPSVGPMGIYTQRADWKDVDTYKPKVGRERCMTPG